MSTPTLAGIGADLDALYAAIEEQDGEITPEQEAALDALLGAEADKVDAYGWRIKQAQADAAGYQAQANAIMEALVAPLRCKAEAAENLQDRLKDRLLAYMTEHGHEKMEGHTWTLTRQKNSSRALEILVEDLDQWPRELLRVRTEVDRASLKGREEVVGDDGTVLARLAPQGHHVRIR